MRPSPFRLRAFDAPPSRKRLYVAVSCTLWIPINVYVIVLLNLVFNPGQYIVSPAMDVLLMWAGFHLSLLGSLHLLVTTCRFFWNRRGKLTGALNANAYASTSSTCPCCE